jgi:DNA ligase (NAD+)
LVGIQRIGGSFAMDKQKYDKIVDDLIRYSKAYYQESKSLISDKDFDMLLKEAEAFEMENPNLIRKDSPTQKVGSDYKQNSKSGIKHSRPMLSLENTYNKDEVTEWYNKMHNEHGVVSVVVEPKYDGVSFAARYKHGKLVQGLTRGDGEVGEDITQNLQLIPDLNKVPTTFSGEVRGEIMITLSEFKRLNEDGKYANPRNLASGSLKLLDPEEFKKRNLIAYVYWLEDGVTQKQSDDLEFIKSLNFRKPYYFLCFELSNILEAIDRILAMKKSGELDVDLDGAVMKVEKKNLWPKIGGTSKFPHWAKAYKYDPETAVTKVKDVEFWVGHAGKITPVAILEPVELSGSTVQKATLNNKTYLEEMDIQIGDHVNIKKAAEIIPYINYVIKDLREGQTRTTVKFPTECPSCGTKLRKYNDEHSDFYCMNESCKSRVIGTIVKYTSTMEIDGFAEIIVEKLYDANLLRSIEDLYSLKDKKSEMAELDRMGKKLVNKLVDNIENSKVQSFEKFLAAISIKNAGKGTAKRLLKKFSSIDEIMEATKEELMEVDDIGDIVAQNIMDYFKENKDFIEKLKSYGVNMEKEKTESTPVLNLLNGKSFCITGALSRVRSEIEQMIETLGGKNVSGVTKKTDYLVTNDQTTPTSKLTKAKELGVKIISELELIEMLTK